MNPCCDCGADLDLLPSWNIYGRRCRECREWACILIVRQSVARRVEREGSEIIRGVLRGGTIVSGEDRRVIDP